MAEFEKYLVPDETPFTTIIGGKKPDFCVEFWQEPKQPEHEIWVQARELLKDITPVDDDEEWWVPSEKYRRLSWIVNRLYEVAFNKVPNLEYDEERCRREWKGGPLKQNKVEWGVGRRVTNRVTGEKEVITFGTEEKVGT